MNSRYAVEFPVKYNEKNFSIDDAKHRVRCRIWQITGMSHSEVHEVGNLVADAMNHKHFLSMVSKSKKGGKS